MTPQMALKHLSYLPTVFHEATAPTTSSLDISFIYSFILSTAISWAPAGCPGQ